MGLSHYIKSRITKIFETVSVTRAIDTAKMTIYGRTTGDEDKGLILGASSVLKTVPQVGEFEFLSSGLYFTDYNSVRSQVPLGTIGSTRAINRFRVSHGGNGFVPANTWTNLPVDFSVTESGYYMISTSIASYGSAIGASGIISTRVVTSGTPINMQDNKRYMDTFPTPVLVGSTADLLLDEAVAYLTAGLTYTIQINPDTEGCVPETRSESITYEKITYNYSEATGNGGGGI